jgi:hypothetical protein
LSRVVGPQAASFVFAAVNIDGPFFLGAVITAPAIFLALAAGRAAGRPAASLAAPQTG